MCNATDNAIWNRIFANDSSVTMLLSSAYSNTRQRVIFPDLVPFRFSPHSRTKTCGAFLRVSSATSRSRRSSVETSVCR